MALAATFGSPAALEGQLDPRPIREHVRTPGLWEMVDIFDFEPVCFANMPQALYDFMARASGSEWTLRRNRHAFDWVEIVERPGAGVRAEAVDTSVELFGQQMAFPILIAPSTNHLHLHPSGEKGTYEGATAAGATMAVASGPSFPIDEIAAASTGPRWQQFYPEQEIETSRRRLDLFLELGARAILVTVDSRTASQSQYDRAMHIRWLGANPPEAPPEPRRATVGGPPPPRPTGPAAYGVIPPGRLWYTWEHSAQLKQIVDVPVLIKGILTAEDARTCVELGFDGVVVSNHGARTLDYAPSTLEVLPEIVDAVDGRIRVLVDSGFRRGSDVFKALALGADAVCVGRATRWGLGAYGPAGVARALEILTQELRDTMALAGVTNLASIDRTKVRTNFP
jgi:isopentenyl diphosphate isomerase/L-lactate dehydrogenase-like FMN-dependent dehydrogenase